MSNENSRMGGNLSNPGSNGATVPSVAAEPVKLEFAVQMTCNSCVQDIRAKLESLPGIDAVDINLGAESVVVQTTLPSYEILQKIQSTGREAILRGVGGKVQQNLGAAVAMISGGNGLSNSDVHGVVRLTQIDEAHCVIDGTIDGLSPGKHGLHIHECGDISQGCYSVGDHYNPLNVDHGSPDNDKMHRHVGDLGNVDVAPDGRAVFRIVDKFVKVWDVIGRSIVITEAPDDLGLGNSLTSKVDGNSGLRLACGIIARSAGLFENSKKICACDGLTLWDERNTPIVGSSRQRKQELLQIEDTSKL